MILIPFQPGLLYSKKKNKKICLEKGPIELQAGQCFRKKKIFLKDLPGLQSPGSTSSLTLQTETNDACDVHGIVLQQMFIENWPFY